MLTPKELSSKTSDTQDMRVWDNKCRENSTLNTKEVNKSIIIEPSTTDKTINNWRHFLWEKEATLQYNKSRFMLLKAPRSSILSAFMSNIESRETKESIMSTLKLRMRDKGKLTSSKWAKALEIESSQATEWRSSHIRSTRETFQWSRRILKILEEERRHLS